MTRRLISNGSPYETKYGFSRAVVDGDYVFVAGTVGYDDMTKELPASVEAQTRNCFKTIAKLLEEGGSSLKDVVRASYYIVDKADAEKVLLICGEAFAGIRPAATLLVISSLLTPDMKVEIEVTARRGRRDPPNG